MLIRNSSLVIHGRRVHHGEIGVLAVVFGLVAILDDIRDRRKWFRS